MRSLAHAPGRGCSAPLCSAVLSRSPCAAQGPAGGSCACPAIAAPPLHGSFPLAICQESGAFGAGPGPCASRIVSHWSHWRWGSSPAPATTTRFVLIMWGRKGRDDGTAGAYWAASASWSGSCGFFPSFWIKWTMCVRSRLRVRMSSSTSSFCTPSMNSSRESSPAREHSAKGC